MRSVVQRVDRAGVWCNGKCMSQIERGILVFLGIERGDQKSDAQYLADKIIDLRIFENERGK
jgi:D-tyrosyl-tRNA(Tyr) deacylase